MFRRGKSNPDSAGRVILLVAQNPAAAFDETPDGLRIEIIRKIWVRSPPEPTLSVFTPGGGRHRENTVFLCVGSFRLRNARSAIIPTAPMMVRSRYRRSLRSRFRWRLWLGRSHVITPDLRGTMFVANLETIFAIAPCLILVNRRTCV